MHAEGRERGKTERGNNVCHQTSGPIIGWAYKWEGLKPGFYGILQSWHYKKDFITLYLTVRNQKTMNTLI